VPRPTFAAMLLVGLTGNIASGKSTVSRMFAERGATIVDSDVLARRAVEPGTAGHAGIAARWGDAVLDRDGRLDRAALRRIVFSDPVERERLNAIVHPEVERMRETLVAEAARRGDRIVVCDIPLLFEKQLADNFDRVVLVDAPQALRLERLMRERGLGEAEAKDMIAAQMPAELKRPHADIVVENDGTIEDLERRVAAAWATLDQAERSRVAGGR
jgi:dephospho-CoA kinase